MIKILCVYIYVYDIFEESINKIKKKNKQMIKESKHCNKLSYEDHDKHRENDIHRFWSSKSFQGGMD